MNHNLHQPERGFTLLELMVVVAIIAILASVAVPSYRSYVDRGLIKTAQADLVALSLNYENQYQRTLSYPDEDYASTADLTTRFPDWSPSSKAANFSFSTSGGTAKAYTLVATGVGGGVSGCVISLTNKNVRQIGSCSYGSGDWL